MQTLWQDLRYGARMLRTQPGLLVRGLQRAMAIDPGFETKKLLSVGYSLELSGYDEARARQFNRELVARLEALPGVKSVVIGNTPFQVAASSSVTLPTESGAAGGQSERISSYLIAAAPGYFETSGIPITRGRGFTADDVRSKSRVVVVSEATARNLWPGQEPIGKLLNYSGHSRSKEPERLVLLREKSGEGQRIPASYPNFADWQARAQSFDGMASARSLAFNLTSVEKAVRLRGRMVNWNFFQLLGGNLTGVGRAHHWQSAGGSWGEANAAWRCDRSGGSVRADKMDGIFVVWRSSD